MKDSLTAKIIESIGWIIIIFSVIIPLIMGIVIASQGGEGFNNILQLGLWGTIMTIIISGSVSGIFVIGFSKIINNTYQNKEISYHILKELEQQKRPQYFNLNNQ